MIEFHTKKFKNISKNCLVLFLLFSTIFGSFPEEVFAANQKIRQEINILAGETLSSSSASQVESSARVLLDTAMYSGTATYYFEAVYNGAASNTGTIKLSRAGTSTYDASINGATSATYRTTRSTAFTPPAGQTEYTVSLVGDGTRTQTVKSARIVVIQESDPIMWSETQIEIGTAETGKANTSVSALSAPKYWNYEADNWDPSQTFYAEATWRKTNNAPQIVYVGGKGAGRTNPSSSVNVALNSGLGGGISSSVAAGDLVIVTVSTGTQANQPSVAVSGYTNLTAQRTTATTYDTNVQTSYKFMPSTPDTQVTIPGTGSNAFGQAYTIHVFRGVDSVTPLDGVTPTYATGSGTNNLPNPASITPSTSGAWIYFGGGGAASAGGTYSAGYLTNFLTYNGADTTDANAGAGYYTGWTSGAYDGAAWTGGSANAANSWGATSLVLRPGAPTTTVTVKLQEDNGSFGGWADKVTIVDASSTDVTTTRTRSASFTPVDGRNYRIVTNQSDSNATHAIYNAKIISGYSYLSSAITNHSTAMVNDGTYLYKGSNGSLVRINKSDLSTANSTGTNNVGGLTLDGSYIYAGFYNTPAVTRYAKDLTSPTTVNFSAGENPIYGITNDTDYVYACTLTTPAVIKRVHKSNFSTVNTLTLNSGDGSCAGLTEDTNYIYASMNTSPSKVVRISKSDFSTTSTLTLSDQNGAWNIFDDDNYVYVIADSSPGEVTRVLKSDFSTNSTITLGSGEDRPLGNAIDSQYLYLSTYTNPMRFIKIRLSDFAVAGRTTLRGTNQNNAFGGAVDEDYFYNGSLVNSTVNKLALVDPLQKFEPQYLLANKTVDAGTGLQNFLAYWDPSDWDGVGTTFYHEVNSAASSSSVAEIVQKKSFSVSSQDTAPRDVALSSDGTIMYMVGNTNDTVYQYTLSTPYDPSTATYASKSFSVGSQDGLPAGIFFKPDGTKMYIMGYNNQRVYQYSLGTAWDVSTASYDSLSFLVTGQTSSAVGASFSDDGTKMYVTEWINSITYQYTLSTAWDVSSASYATKSYDSSLHQAQMASFSNNGGYMYLTEDYGTAVRYTLSTPWDISTVSASANMVVHAGSSNGSGFGSATDGTNFYYMSGSQQQVLYQSTVSGSTVSSPNNRGKSSAITTLGGLGALDLKVTTNNNDIYSSRLLVNLSSLITTLGDGTDGANVTLAPGDSAQEIDRFSLVTNSGTDTVTGMTVTLAGDANAYQNVATVDVHTTTSSSWTSRDSARAWFNVASSDDGVKVAATVTNGYIYTSTDSGATWTERTNSGQRNWASIASSSDGAKLVASVYGGYIYTSTDSGATWTEQTSSGSRNWYEVTSSSDGTKLAAVANNGYVYTSTDSGATWTERTNSNIRNWRSLASSADGTKLAAGVYGGYVFTSNDSGATWTQRTNSGIRNWRAIRSSSDGTKLSAVIDNGNYVYTSDDSGVNWTQRTNSGSRNWQSIASSADGTKLVAVAYPAYVYTSTDSGANWTEQTGSGSRNWYSVASSADGNKIVGLVSSGNIYTYIPSASTSKCSATPSSNTVNLTSCGISVTTSSTEYKILITPKTHANMPAVPGASYDITATVTSVTSNNSISGTDTNSATVTIDNASPANATSTSGTVDTGAVILSWTASNSADISQSVVLRWAASTPGSEVPVEGTQYIAGATISTATVACVIGSTASQAHASIIDGTGGTTGCTTSALTNGQAYSYKVFSRDIRNNYDVGVTFTGSPFTPTAGFVFSGTSSGLSDGTIVRVVINGSLDANASSTITSNAWSINPSGADPTTGQSVVVFVTDGDGDIADNLEATAISVYDGSGDMTGMSLVPGTLSIGSANSQPVALSNIDDYTCSSDEDVMHSVSASVLTVQGCSNSYTGEILSVLASNTFTVGNGETVATEKINNSGFFNASGSPTINVSGTEGTLWTGYFTTPATSTVNVTGNGDATFNTISSDFYNLNFSGTGTKTLGAGITIAPSGTLTVSAGTFAPSTYAVTSNNSGQTLAVSSGATLNVSASTFAGSYPGGWTSRNLNANSTVDYNLAGTQTVDGTLTYGNLTISGSGTKSITQTTTVNGVLTLSGGTFDTTSQGLSAGRIVLNGGTFDAGFSAIVLSGTSGTLYTFSSGTSNTSNASIDMTGNGDAIINSGSPTFSAIVTHGTGTKTLGANVTISVGGAINLAAGTLDPSTYLVTGSGSNTIIVTGATLAVGGAVFTDSYSAGFNGFTMNAGAIVDYNRNGAQTIKNDINYVGLKTSTAGTKTLAGNAIVSGSVEIGSSTTLALGSNTLTLSGTGASVLAGSGTLDGGTGKVAFTGNGAVTVPAKGYYNLELSPTITDNRTYTLDATTVAGNLVINPTAGSALALTTNMGANLTVTGTTTIQRTTSATAALDTDTGTDRNLSTGYLNIQTGGTLDAGGSASDITLTGTSGTLFTNYGTFTPGSSTLILSGNGDANINTNIPLTANNLTISGTGIKKAIGGLTLNGTLNVSNANGAFHNGGQNLSVTGNVTNSGTFAVAPVSEGWEYYRTITIDKTKVPGTVTDFPVLVSGTYTYLKTTGNAGKVRNANGYDVAFFADQALTQPLKFERVNWSATTGEVEYWVKVPAVSHLVDTVIYMAYGNTNITTDLSDRTNVWDSNFKGVYHLPDGTTLNTNDSTINANNATNTEATAISGKIDGGVGIIDSGDKLTITDISLAGGVYTISTWFEMPLSSNATGWNTLTRGINNDHQVIVNRANGELGMYKNGAGDFRTSGYDTDGLSNGWHHLVARTSGTTTLFYIDGAYVGTADSISTAEITTLGNYQLYTQPWGEIDELRISTGVSRSTDWITTEYNNQNNPATFYTIGNESTSVSPTVTVTGTVTNSGTFNAGTTDGDATAFLRATGITDPLISKAVGDLVTSAKLHGWWDKTDAIYPFVGGTADTHKYNLKDPRDLDAAFRLVFQGGWTHNATGADPNGTTGYAETNLVPSSVLNLNDVHVSYYSKDSAASSSTSYEVGAMNGSTQELGLIIRRSNDSYYSILFDETSTLVTGATNTDGVGFFMGSRTASNAHDYYRDGVSFASNTNAQAGTLPTHEIYLAGLNLNGGLYGPSDKKVGFATIGDGISSALAQQMYLDIKNFRDAVERNEIDTTITGPVINIGGTGTAWNNTGNVIAGASTIKLTDTSASAKTFAGGGDTYNNLWLAGGSGGGSYTISGNNIFNDFKSDGSVAHTISFTAGSTQTLETFSVIGTNGNPITINSTTSSPFNLVKTGTADIDSDYLTIQYSTVTPYGEWIAGTHSTDMGSNSGWIFNTRGGSRKGGGGNAGGESSGGGTPVGGGEGTCSDGQQNGNETGVDTGGRCSTGGGGGGAGGEGGGGGQGQTGGEGTCSDGQQNGNETGVDTGGRCSTGGGGGDTGYIYKKNLLAYAGGVNIFEILRYIFKI